MQRQKQKQHHTVSRPWGSFESLYIGEGVHVKRLTVDPGARLSLQSHQKRAEHWVVVHGVAVVTRGEKTMSLSVNESTYIAQGVRHRLENAGTDPLVLIEVQVGSYFGEDDIVRYEDDFNRATREA